ncbi:uncharacterized protein L201_000836 [Kwoniella dendrophila CBS 6074]|uniref:Uncharacterized protein n=1 Tax=Kwoniella dendrophila CBS 6074 TaxID=1295534 RepID=A0AAX4JKN4_9TREE
MSWLSSLSLNFSRAAQPIFVSQTPDYYPDMTADGEVVVYDDMYNDASASTILISSDQIHFMVDPYPLKKGSTVLCGMLSDPSLTPSLIPLDIHSGDLRVFLSLLDFGEPVQPTTTEGWQRLLEISDKYECAGLRTKIRDLARVKAFQNPWESFGLASQLEDEALATDAIKLMNGDNAHHDI